MLSASRSTHTRWACAGILLICFSFNFSHLPDGQNRFTLGVILLGIEVFICTVLIVGRHWVAALVGAGLLAATYTRFLPAS